MLLIYNVHSDVYFRKGGLERSASIEKDLEWFREQGFEIPEPVDTLRINIGHLLF
jgi:hypothetical protein